MWWWLGGWGSSSDPSHGAPRRPASEVVSDTLMSELSWQSREVERAQRERESEARRQRGGADYTWLQSAPPSSHGLTAGERMCLEELCAQVPPHHCGLIILRFREAVLTHEPSVQEVSGLFRSVLLHTLDELREQQEAHRLAQQWAGHKRSLSLLSFRSRVRINPFSSGGGGDEDQPPLHTVSQDVERGVANSLGGVVTGLRGWSVPDFRQHGLSGKVV